MIVYVETNFLMEVAREQAQSAACATLLQMADSGTIRLTLPGCCLLEAFRTLSNALFVTRDGDFSGDEVLDLIRDRLHCKLLSSFKHAVDYLKNRSDPA